MFVEILEKKLKTRQIVLCMTDKARETKLKGCDFLYITCMLFYPA